MEDKEEEHQPSHPLACSKLIEDKEDEHQSSQPLACRKLMEDKEEEHQPSHPLACTSCHARLEEEIASSEKQTKLKNRLKYYLFIVALTALETGIILLFALTVLKFKTPNFRVRAVAVQTLRVGNTSNPYFSIAFKAEFNVKNRNFGHFSYHNTTVYFYYEDVRVGRAFIHKSRVDARSTRKFYISVKLTSSYVSRSSILFLQDLNAGVLPISMQSKLRGRVTVLKLLKNDRATNLNCNMDVVVKKRQLRNLKCK
ncbi:late embryogenesis abundant protein At1g64065-like [Apium graveolens]|uniref:late embryogenesis abundant protein At1g64065-like n=1 Tax=Apium graveolens TaxID=4045 RepID=UPI003D79A127